jgi:hypothetical protein
MRHLKLYEDLSGTPQTLTLYVYEYEDPHGSMYVGFLAPDEEFMNQIMKEVTEDDDSDHEGGSVDNLNGAEEYYLQKEMKVSVAELLKLDIGSEDNINSLFGILTRPGITFEDLDAADKKAITEYMEIGDATYRFLTFDAKAEAERYSKLTNEMLDQLCLEIIKYRTWDDDSRGFKRIER